MVEGLLKPLNVIFSAEWLAIPGVFISFLQGTFPDQRPSVAPSVMAQDFAKRYWVLGSKYCPVDSVRERRLPFGIPEKVRSKLTDKREKGRMVSFEI